MFWRRNTDWELWLALTSKVLLDGTTECGYLMRRRVNRDWQYRRETPEELIKFQKDMAI